ncbi:MAG: GNAT family N-acetyltransferase [Candidatus Cloacimonetes bacterium]|nr:GNAT family N-acetyltransferase [Candidatus Cloacimonadota bacterium]
MIFQTSRLYIKKLALSDVNHFYKLHSDPQVMEPIPAPVLNHHSSKQELHRILNAYKVKDHRLRVYGVYLHSNDDFVGLCAIIRPDSKSRSIGYRLLKDYWGQGLGTEGMINFLKQDKSLQSIQASVDQNNIASKKILQRFMAFVKDELNSKSGSYESQFKLDLLTPNSSTLRKSK